MKINLYYFNLNIKIFLNYSNNKDRFIKIMKFHIIFIIYAIKNYVNIHLN